MGTSPSRSQDGEGRNSRNVRHSGGHRGNGLYFGNTMIRPGTRIPAGAGSMEALLIAQMRPDMAYMYPALFEQMLHQPPPPPEVQHTNTVRSDINLRKDTLKLVPVPSTPSSYTLEFTLDAAVAGGIHVFYNSQETADPNGLPIFAPITVAAPPPVSFPKELNQQFHQPQEHALDTTKFRSSELIYRTHHPNIYPIVIVLLANIGTGPDESRGVQAQITFCTLQLKGDNQWDIKVIKQKILVNGQAYVLQEIYGIDQRPASESVSKENAGLGSDGMDMSECVICLTENRDTTVLPCRHMCLCHDCAEVLRHKSNKCPVCRGAVESFLQIKIDKTKSEEEGTKHVD